MEIENRSCCLLTLLDELVEKNTLHSALHPVTVHQYDCHKRKYKNLSEFKWCCQARERQYDTKPYEKAEIYEKWHAVGRLGHIPRLVHSSETTYHDVRECL